MLYGIALAAVVLSVVVGGAVTAWLLARHPRGSPVFAFGLFTLTMTAWSATHLGTMLSTSMQWQLFFTQLSYVPAVTVPVAWLAFAFRYTDRREWLSRRRLAVLSVVPAVTLAFTFTAQYHSLYYASVELVSTGVHPTLSTTSGPVHVLCVLYAYALLFAGTGLVVAEGLSDNRLYRRQAAVLVACLGVPWLVNVGYHLGVGPVPWFDPTPVAFAAAEVPLAAVVVRTDLTSVLPVAHERVFRTLADPVLVVTPEGRVVDANDTARSVLGDGGPVVGESVAAVLPDELLDGDGLRTDLDGPIECAVDDGGDRREYLARCRPTDPGRDGPVRGYLVSLTDITVQKDQQRTLERRRRALEAQTDRLERKNEQLERLADVVSHDMGAPLSTAEKVLSLLRADLDDPDPSVERSLDDLDGVHDRLRGFADHLPRLARESVDVETTEACDLERLAEAAWDVVETGDLELVVADSHTLEGDERRLRQVFENLFRNTVEHGSTSPRSHASEDAVELEVFAGTAPDAHDADSRDGTARLPSVVGDGLSTDGSGAGTTADGWPVGATTVRVGTFDGGVFVEDDGPGIPEETRESVFEYGTSTGDGSGFGLAIVRSIVEAHGWEVEATESDVGGARFEIRTA